MSTQVLRRASVRCFDCNKTHQIRHVDRGPSWTGPGQREAVYSGRANLDAVLPVVDQAECFELAVALVSECNKLQGPCPISDNRHATR